LTSPRHFQAERAAPLIVIDDDPTGVQEEEAVVLLFDWSSQALHSAAERSHRAIHLLTNSRAFSEDDAYLLVRDAAGAVVEHLPGHRLVLRGDSTLRAHLLAEYLALRDSAFPGRNPACLLIPALPSASRVTVDGVHWLVRNGERVPLAETEYASDGAFSYSCSRLLKWAEERSYGYFKAEDGREFPLNRLRGTGGAQAFAATLRELARTDRPAVFAPDAETTSDLRIIADGVAAAESEGTDLIIRCAPAFVGVSAGTFARKHVEVPRPSLGVLLIVGSHVPTTTRQLERLLQQHRESLIEVDPALLISPAAADHAREVVATAAALLAAEGLAVVATKRPSGRVESSQAEGLQLARELAGIVAGVRESADVFIAKGGITSAIVAREGFGAREADVVGPVVDGVSLWHIPSRRGDLPFIVFPGNVGDDGALSDLVDRVLAPR
jgi:uncharacterized protein YgbK (DUF1537 family)